MQLEGEIKALKHEVLDLKDRLAEMDSNKHTWEEEKQNMQKRIDELNDYSTPEYRSPPALAMKDMSKMSLKDLEITWLEANQELKDRITAKESEYSIEEIMTLKEKVTRFEERAICQIPLQGAKHLLCNVVVKEMPSLEKHLVMEDEHKQDAMVARRRCKSP